MVAIAATMVAVPVGPDLRTVVVGTPGYFARRNPPATPADLERHVCVNYRQLGGGGILPWEFEERGRDIKIRVTGPLIVNDEALSAAAVAEAAELRSSQTGDVLIQPNASSIRLRAHDLAA